METDISSIYNVSEHDRLLQVSEVAEKLNIGKSLTYRLIKSGDLPAIRISNCVRVTDSDLEKFISNNRTGGDTL